MVGGTLVNKQTISREDALIAHTRSNARFLFQEGDLIVGREGTSGGTADANGSVAFAISINGSTGVLTVAEYTALQVKQSVVGNGHAKKEQVQHMVRRLLALPGNPAPDAADALACAICHAHGAKLGALTFPCAVQPGFPCARAEPPQNSGTIASATTRLVAPRIVASYLAVEMSPVSAALPTLRAPRWRRSRRRCP